MDQKVSTLFYPRKPKSHEKRNDMPVYMRITVKKESCPTPDRIDFSTGKWVDRTKWLSIINPLGGRTAR